MLYASFPGKSRFVLNGPVLFSKSLADDIDGPNQTKSNLANMVLLEPASTISRGMLLCIEDEIRTVFLGDDLRVFSTNIFDQAQIGVASRSAVNAYQIGRVCPY